jgi:hypothetical protein
VLTGLAVGRIILALLTIILAADVLAVNATFAQRQPLSGNEFYFHYKSELYRNENSSVIGLEEANFSLPAQQAPKVIDVSAAIRNATTFFGTIWVGSVAWLTPPFSAPTAIRGELEFDVWLASNESAPLISGVGAGVAAIDGEGQQVGSYAYSYSYGQGNILTSTPREYTFKVNYNQEIPLGGKLILAVGLGATTAYWRMQVYFDSTNYASRAQLPTNVTIVPEFATPILGITTCVAIALSLTLIRRRRGKL